MTGAEYIAFLGAVAILVLTPGPDTFLTLRFAAHQLKAGVVYSVAAALGTLVWAVLALTGVAALLQRFPDIRVVLTWVGGAFLVYLGANALLHVRAALRGTTAGRRRVAATTPDDTAPEAPAGTAPAVVTAVRAEATTRVEAPVVVPTITRLPVVFRTGVISSLTNPKTGLFFLALLPPFLPASPGVVDHVLLLATVAACMFVYGVLLSVVARRVGRFLTKGRGPLVVDTVAGGMLILLGVSLILL